MRVPQPVEKYAAFETVGLRAQHLASIEQVRLSNLTATALERLIVAHRDDERVREEVAHHAGRPAF